MLLSSLLRLVSKAQVPSAQKLDIPVKGRLALPEASLDSVQALSFYTGVMK